MRDTSQCFPYPYPLDQTGARWQLWLDKAVTVSQTTCRFLFCDLPPSPLQPYFLFLIFLVLSSLAKVCKGPFDLVFLWPCVWCVHTWSTFLLMEAGSALRHETVFLYILSGASKRTEDLYMLLCRGTCWYSVFYTGIWVTYIHGSVWLTSICVS